jgi:hypothetical protein
MPALLLSAAAAALLLQGGVIDNTEGSSSSSNQLAAQTFKLRNLMPYAIETQARVFCDNYSRDLDGGKLLPIRPNDVRALDFPGRANCRVSTFLGYRGVSQGWVTLKAPGRYQVRPTTSTVPGQSLRVERVP